MTALTTWPWWINNPAPSPFRWDNSEVGSPAVAHSSSLPENTPFVGCLPFPASLPLSPASVCLYLPNRLLALKALSLAFSW